MCIRLEASNDCRHKRIFALAIAGYCGKSAALDNALAKFAKLYADQTESDYEQFKKAIAKGRVCGVLGK